MDCHSSSRRNFMAGCGMTALACAMPAESQGASSDCAQLAQEAVVWGFPLMMAGLYLNAAIENGVEFDRFQLAAGIASAKASGVGSNIDTLNGLAWIDLTGGPKVIGVPDTADRYYTIQLQDMYMNSFAYIGRRTTGTAAGFFAITPPGYAGNLPSGITEIRSPTTKVLAFLRTLVRAPDDIEAVRAINWSVTIGPLAGFPSGQRGGTMKEGALSPFQPKSRLEGKTLPHKEIAQSGARYFTELDRLVREFPPHDWDAPNLARFAPLGIGREAASHGCSDAELAAAAEAGVDLAVRSVKSFPDNGWLRRQNVAAIVRDPLERAANTVYGPGTQIAEESVFYNLRQGPDGEVLSGANRYRLRFPPGELPPVDAFWSLTLYDGNYYIFDNPLDRYGITDRSEGLSVGADGSLEIFVQADEPEEGHSNWIPCPREAFQLVFRTYQPRQPLIDGSYHLPPLEIVT